MAKSKEKREVIQVHTMTLRYPKVSRPDTYGDKADGKYKTDFLLVSNEMPEAERKRGEELVKLIKAKAKELLPKSKNPKLPLKHVEKDGERTGEITMKASSKFMPVVTDARGQEIPVKSVEGLRIAGGTRARAALALNAFDGRLSLYLNGLQLVKLVQYETGGGKPKFDAVDGEDGDDGFSFESTGDADDSEDSSDGEKSESSEDDDSDDAQF